MFLIPSLTRSNYGSNTKWGATFKRFIQSILEALRGSYPKAKQLSYICKFHVTLLGGTKYSVEVHPGHYMATVATLGGRGIRTTEFDDILEPILAAIEAAKLTDSDKAFPNSELKQATKEEHEFSHRLNSP